MIITNECEYRQYLQRRKALTEQINNLHSELVSIRHEIVNYMGTPQWLKDRGLEAGEGKLITGAMNQELTGDLSVGNAPVVDTEAEEDSFRDLDSSCESPFEEK